MISYPEFPFNVPKINRDVKKKNTRQHEQYLGECAEREAGEE